MRDDLKAGDLITGDAIQIRDASGNWHDKTARSCVFLNVRDAPRKTHPWLVVQVDLPGFDHPVNWPAADVRRPLVDAQ